MSGWEKAWDVVAWLRESDMEDGMRDERRPCEECGWLVYLEGHESDCPENEKED